MEVFETLMKDTKLLHYNVSPRMTDIVKQFLPDKHVKKIIFPQ